MNSKRSLIIVTALIFAAAITVLAVWGNATKNPQDTVSQTPSPTPTLPAETTPVPTPEVTSTPKPEETPEPEPQLTTMKLAIAGDIVMHPGLSSEAKTGDEYDYSSVFGGATGYLSSADYAVATIKGSFPGETTYTGYPLIKAPDAMAKAVSEIGIDLVATATRNSFDSDLAGLRRTLDVLEQNGLEHVGTSRSREELNETGGVKLVEVNGITLAFLSYSCIPSGVDNSSEPYSVNIIYDEATDTYNYSRLESDIAYVREQGADVTLVFLQWGREYYTQPSKAQQEMADFLFLQGADVIVGGHPYVPQPMETRQVTDKYGNSKTGYICYSLGNLVSCLTDEYTNLTAIVNIEIEKNLDTGETYFTGLSYVPMFMVDLNAYNVTGSSWRYRLWDLHTAINSYEDGNNLGVITEKLYDAMRQGLSDIHGIFGEDTDVYN